MNFWLLASLFLGSMMLTACGDDDNDGSSSDTPTPSEKVDFSKTGGSISVNKKDGSQISTITVPKYSAEDLSGVEIIDNDLCFSYNQSEDFEGGYSYCGCYLTVQNYSESKTSYTNVIFNISEGSYDGTSNKYYQGNTVYSVDGQPKPSNITATVKKLKDGIYEISVEGDLYMTGSDISMTNATANATVKLKVVAPLIAVSKLHKNVSSKQSYFPAGTPWLNGKTVAGALEMKSSLLGSGVLLWYYGVRQSDGSYDLNYAQYEDLKAQAVKLMGQPFECYDATILEGEDKQRGWNDMSYAYFYKDKKFVMVSYCPWRDTYEGEEPGMPYGIEALHENHAARIQVHILDGMTVDYNQFVFSMR